MVSETFSILIKYPFHSFVIQIHALWMTKAPKECGAGSNSAALKHGQCTMHLTLCADGDTVQPKPVIIFRGSGKTLCVPVKAKNG
jgi:hypothetical protein